MKEKPIISPFQALTLLIKTYRNDAQNLAIYNHCITFYLVGMRSQSDADIFEQLMDEPCLAPYTVKADKITINQDPVRRYFESYLSYETLMSSLSQLDWKCLKQHDEETFLKHVWSSAAIEDFQYGWEMHAKAMACLQDHSESSQQKIETLYRLMYITMYLNTKDASSVFGEERYFLDNEVRGREYAPVHAIPERLLETMVGFDNPMLPACNLGIMKDFMPLPANDILFSSVINQKRFVNKFTYSPKAVQTQLSFFHGVVPFVGSISGGMARHIIKIHELNNEGRFVYRNNVSQLQCYFKCLFSLSLFISGNHSLDEFVRVLELPEVQYVLEAVDGMSSLTFNNLFKDQNKQAFTRALNRTIQYNDDILQRKNIHHGVKMRVQSVEPVNENRRPVLPSLDSFIIQEFNQTIPLNAISERIKGDATGIRATDRNAIAWLVFTGHNQLLKWLLDYVPGQDVNERNKYLKATALDLALNNGNLVTIRLLMRVRAKATKPPRRLSDYALRDLIHVRCNEGIQILLTLNPSLLNKNDRLGYTPLHRATILGYVDIVQMLLRAGADIRICSTGNAVSLAGQAYPNMTAYEMSCQQLNHHLNPSKARYHIAKYLKLLSKSLEAVNKNQQVRHQFPVSSQNLSQLSIFKSISNPNKTDDFREIQSSVSSIAEITEIAELTC